VKTRHVVRDAFYISLSTKLRCPAFRELDMRQKFSHLSFEERKTISRVRGQKFNQSESPDPALSAE